MDGMQQPAAAPKRKLSTSSKGDHEHVARISTQTTFVVLLTASFVLYEIRLILLPFVFAALLAYILTPVIDMLTARTGTPRWLPASGVFLVLLAFGSLIGLLGIPPFLRELARALTDLNGTIEAIIRALIGNGKIGVLGQPMNAAELADAATAAMRNWLGNPSGLADIASYGVITIFGGFLTIVLLLYFLVSGPSIAAGLIWLIPPAQRPLIEDHIWTVLDPVLRRYFIGVIGIVCFASLAAYLGLGIALELPHAPVMALLTGFLEAIPIAGQTMAIAITAAVAVHSATSIAAIVGYALYVVALRLAIDQLFGPLVLGAAGRVHPVLIIFCFLAGGALFGVVGVIMAVPVALTIKATLATLYDDPSGFGTMGRRSRAD